jgi:hypothetical protein
MDFWINSIKMMSIVLAGFFGTLGLLTKYRDKNDKITRPGKFALGGIIFTAGLSLMLQFLQTSKESAQQTANAIRSAAEARKSEASAKETSKRLEDILTTAKTTSGQQEENLAKAELLTEQMNKSLVAQRDVLAGNKRILSGIVEGAQRDTQNTIGILRTLWDESNRIEANQITVEVTYSFLRETVKQPPPLLESEESLSLLADTDDPAKLSFPLNRWSSRHLLDGKELLLRAKEQNITQRKHYTVDGIGYQQTSYFSGFEGDIRSFFDMTKWNGALIEVLLTKQDPSLVDKLKASLDWEPERKHDLEDLKRRYDVPSNLEEMDYHITPLPVVARLTIYIRERPIATSEAVLVRAWEHDEDVRGLIVAKFRIAQVPDNTFPQFKPTLSDLR